MIRATFVAKAYSQMSGVTGHSKRFCQSEMKRHTLTKTSTSEKLLVLFILHGSFMITPIVVGKLKKSRILFITK